VADFSYLPSNSRVSHVRVISVFSPGLYPNQFKKVLLHPGETIYVRIDSLRNWYRGFNWENDTFVVSLVSVVFAAVLWSSRTL